MNWKKYKNNNIRVLCSNMYRDIAEVKNIEYIGSSYDEPESKRNEFWFCNFPEDEFLFHTVISRLYSIENMSFESCQKEAESMKETGTSRSKLIPFE